MGCKDLDEVRQRLEGWFNNSMERVSGAYKRYTQFWLYVWATLIVVWLNVDAVEIGRRLIADAQLRSTLAAGGISFVAQANSPNAPAMVDSNPLAAVAGSSSNTMASTPQIHSTSNAFSVSDLVKEISKLNLPIGWGACSNDNTKNSLIGWVMNWLPRLEQNAESTNTNTNAAVNILASGVLTSAAPCPNNPEAWRLKLIGLLITIAAISQGAPFWFDLLNRVTNLRAAGRPPKEKKDSV
jgi:hypothetical protein